MTPADLDVQIRTAGTWDTAAIVDTMAPALERTSLVWWLHPLLNGRAQSVRDYVRRLTGTPAEQITIRIIERDGLVLGAAIWTTCTTTCQPGPQLTVCGAAPHRQRAAWLQTQLARMHPAEHHDHLLQLAVRTGHQRRGVGSALLADAYPRPTAQPHPRFVILSNRLTPAAMRLGYESANAPVTITTTVSLHGLKQAPNKRSVAMPTSTEKR